MGKTTQSTTQSNSPPANVMQNYQALVDQAKGVASTPYQQYNGQIVPDLVNDQLLAMHQMDYASTVTPQYYNQAQNYLNSAANPINLSAGNTSQYVSPYSQSGAANATAAGQGLSAYGTNSGQAIANYGTGAGQNIGNYAYNIGASGPQLQQYNAQNLAPYLDPYTQSVINATGANIDRSNAIQQNDLLGAGIKAGNAFGGDRAGIAQAELARNQDLAKNQVMAGLQSQGFQNAQSQFNANNQQALAGKQTALSGLSSGANLGLGAMSNGANLGVNAQQAGANLGLAGANMGTQGYQNAQQLALAQQQAQNANSLNAGNSMGNLGTAALNSYLASANAQLQSGNQQQQQWGAQLQVPYQQFLQQQAYPFQTTQWLGNQILGTGTASGGTGTTTSPGPNVLSQVLGLGATAAGAFMASDERVKQNKEIIGKTFDGQPIYRFNYVGSPTTQLGLMAQNVEHSHPDAVAEHGGLKYVNYDAATDQAADKGHFAEGGIVGLSANAPGMFSPIDFNSHGIRGYVPDAGQIKMGAGPPKAPNAPGATAAPNTNALGSALGKGLAGMGGEGDFVGSPGVDSPLPMIGSTGDYAVPTFMATGGLVAPDAAFQGFADGGMPDEIIDQTDLPPLQEVSPQAMAEWRKSSDFALNHPDAGDQALAFASPDAKGLVPVPRPRPAGLDEAPAGDIPPAPASYNVADRQPAGLAAAPPPDQPAEPQQAPSGGLGSFLSSMFSPSQANAQGGPRPATPPNMGQALMAAGLGMMSSRNPTLLGGVGEGGTAGLQNYMAQQKAYNELDQHPVVDHSGPTTRIYYPSTKQWIDTGIPTITAGQKQTNERLIEQAKESQADRKQRADETKRYHGILDAQRKDALDEKKRERDNPANYRQKADGSGLEPIPGGPADPVAIKAAADAKRGTAGLLDEETLSDMAGQYLAGDKSVMQNLGRGTQGAENIVKLRAEIGRQAREAGLKPDQVATKMADFAGRTAAMRTLGTRGANVEYAANTANKAIDLAEEAYAKLPRGQFVPFNQLRELYEKKTSSAEQAAAYAATNTLVNEYARVASGGSSTATEGMRQHAREMLNTAQGPDAFNAVLKMMRREIQTAKSAYNETRKEFLEDHSTAKPAGSAPPPTAQPGAAAAASTPPRVRQNGHTYERQSDGSYKAID